MSLAQQTEEKRNGENGLQSSQKNEKRNNFIDPGKKVLYENQCYFYIHSLFNIVRGSDLLLQEIYSKIFLYKSSTLVIRSFSKV